MNLRSVLVLVGATSLVACSGNALRGLGFDAGVGPTSDVATDGHDAAAPFNPCPAAPEPESGVLAAGESCLTTEECYRTAGEAAVCGPSSDADVLAKVQTCHRFSRVARGAACAASRTLRGELVALFPAHRQSQDVPPQAGLCDARDGLTCDWISNTCTPFAALGTDCTTHECGVGNHCGGSGICEAPLALGQSCSIAGDLSGVSWCQAGSYCGIETSVCEAQGAEGATCHFGFQCQFGYCRNGVCGPQGTACIP